MPTLSSFGDPNYGIVPGSTVKGVPVTSTPLQSGNYALPGTRVAGASTQGQIGVKNDGTPIVGNINSNLSATQANQNRQSSVIASNIYNAQLPYYGNNAPQNSSQAPQQMGNLKGAYPSAVTQSTDNTGYTGGYTDKDILDANGKKTGTYTAAQQVQDAINARGGLGSTPELDAALYNLQNPDAPKTGLNVSSGGIENRLNTQMNLSPFRGSAPQAPIDPIAARKAQREAALNAVNVQEQYQTGVTKDGTPIYGSRTNEKATNDTKNAMQAHFDNQDNMAQTSFNTQTQASQVAGGSTQSTPTSTVQKLIQETAKTDPTTALAMQHDQEQTDAQQNQPLSGIFSSLDPNIAAGMKGFFDKQNAQITDIQSKMDQGRLDEKAGETAIAQVRDDTMATALQQKKDSIDFGEKQDALNRQAVENANQDAKDIIEKGQAQADLNSHIAYHNQEIQNTETEMQNRNLAAKMGINYDSGGIKWMQMQQQKGVDALGFISQQMALNDKDFANQSLKRVRDYTQNVFTASQDALQQYNLANKTYNDSVNNAKGNYAAGITSLRQYNTTMQEKYVSDISSIDTNLGNIYKDLGTSLMTQTTAQLNFNRTFLWNAQVNAQAQNDNARTQLAQAISLTGGKPSPLIDAALARMKAQGLDTSGYMKQDGTYNPIATQSQTQQDISNQQTDLAARKAAVDGFSSTLLHADAPLANYTATKSSYTAFTNAYNIWSNPKTSAADRITAGQTMVTQFSLAQSPNSARVQDVAGIAAAKAQNWDQKTKALLEGIFTGSTGLETDVMAGLKPLLDASNKTFQSEALGALTGAMIQAKTFNLSHPGVPPVTIYDLTTDTDLQKAYFQHLPNPYDSGSSASGSSSSASSTGAFSPSAWMKGGSQTTIGDRTVTGTSDLLSKVQQADSSFFQATGKHLNINSSYRTNAQQQQAYNDFLSGKIARAAKPGTSLHEKGMAVDVTNWKEAEPYLVAAGLNPLGPVGSQVRSEDPGHFQLSGDSGQIATNAGTTTGYSSPVQNPYMPSMFTMQQPTYMNY